MITPFLLIAALVSAPNTAAGQPPPGVTSPKGVSLARPPRAVFARLSSPAVATISWLAAKDDANGVGYEILRNGHVVAAVSATAITEGGLQLGSEYCWSVRALDRAGNKTAPVSACVTTPPVGELYDDELAAPRLPAPHEVTATLTARDRVQLRWPASRSAAGAVRYEIRRGASVTATSRETTVSLANLATATRHCFTVTALDSAGNSSAPSVPACAETPDVTPPSVPRALTVLAISSSEVNITWSPSTDDVGVVRYEVWRGDERRPDTTGLVVSEHALSSAHRYCYTVRAYDAAGNSSPAAGPTCTETPIGLPAAPLEVAAQAAGEGVIDVRWLRPREDVVVSGYDVVLDGRVVASATETKVTVTQLSAGRDYCFTVRSRTPAGMISAASMPACAKTLDLTPPAPPPEFVARAVSDKDIELRWGAAADNVATVRYEVVREGKEGVSVEATELREGALHPSQEYCYVVTAMDEAGNRSFPSRACATTPDLTPPTAPTSVAAAAPLPNLVEIGWSPSEDDVEVVGYEVLRDGKIVANVTEAHAAESNLTANKEYCYEIRALDAAGHRSDLSPSSCAKTLVSSAKPAPRNVRAVATSKNTISLTWDPPRDDLVYVVMWEGGAWIGATRAPTFVAAGLRPGERHCYTVATMDEGGTVARSAPACVATNLEGSGEHVRRP